MIALIEAHRARLFKRENWLSNIVAGVIVGVVALPLAMAFAIASGARPEQGLYTAIIGGGLVTLLGGSRVQIAGPTGAFVVILAGITAEYGIAGLQLATLLAGAMLLLMGMLRLGGVIKFIPAPVIVGFTSGIGVIIFVGQWRDFFGLPAITAEHFHEQLPRLLAVLPQASVSTTALALLSLFLIIVGPKIKGLRRIPGPLLALVVVTLLQTALQLPGVATIGSAFGGIPSGFPTFSLPTFSIAQVIELLGPAFSIAMLGAIESLLSAVIADGMAGTRHDSNQELIGQGIANLAAPLFGGFAATGAIARTATNIRNGANSPLAGILHALTLIAILLFLAPLASGIPMCVLAAILFVVAWNMSEVHRFTHILRIAPTADRAILVITFLLTVFTDLVIAVNIGVLLAVLHFLRRMTTATETQAIDSDTLLQELGRHGINALPPNLVVYEIAGPMFFGAVDQFEGALLHSHSDPEVLVIRMRRVPFLDITAMQILIDVIGKLQKRGVRTIITEANSLVLSKLRKANIVQFENNSGLCRYYENLVAVVTDITDAKARR